jgi:uncharacterized protein YrrD
MSDDERPIAWLALRKGIAVQGSDGKEIGKVEEVVADIGKDIFSGLIVDTGLFDRSRFVPADLIERMTTAEVRLTIPAGEADRRLEPPPH